MKNCILTLLFSGLAAAPAWADGLSTHQKTATYETSLKVPDAPLAIPALKAEIQHRYDASLKDLAKEAAEDKDASPKEFHPYMLDVQWRVTFESPGVLSLSGLSFVDEGGAHPSNGYDTIVWDKTANRAVALPGLFVKTGQTAALHDISEYAKGAFARWLSKAQGSPAESDQIGDNIAPDKLGHYALTYAKGDTKANGIVLLWGAGEAWPNVVGDVKLSIPAATFRKYLTPQWAAQFK